MHRACCSVPSREGAGTVTPAQFAEWQAGIEAAYASLGHTLGKRFLYCSRQAFSARPRILLLGLNPAGDRDYPDHPFPSCEGGNAFFVEAYGQYPPGRSPLQLQVQQLYDQLRSRSGSRLALPEFALKEVVGAQLIPFRSPSFESLHRRAESVEFAAGLWRRILEVWRPERVVSFSKDAVRILQPLLGRPEGVRRYPAGWGSQQLELLQFRDDTRLLRLPHLSRFALFGRAQSKPGLQAAFDDLFGGPSSG
jgi:hypothetical protein